MHQHLAHITSKIKALAQSGRIVCARKLFGEMPQRDCIAWNAMLSSYSQLGLHQEAFSLFLEMRTSQIRPDHFTFTSTLSAIAGLKELQNGREVHALIVVSGCGSSLPVNNALIDMYGKCLRPYNARRVFEEMGFVRNEVSWCSLLFAYVNANEFDVAGSFFNAMPKRVVVGWNTLIAGYAQYGELELCLGLFRKMLMDLCRPDEWTLSAIMSACAESSEFCYGCMIHGFVAKSGWSGAVEVSNSILSFYARFNCQKEVLRVVECIGVLSQVSWNAIIDAHMKLGNIWGAFLAFQQGPEKNVVSWTSMISGFARNGFGEEAIGFFVDMMRIGLKPDDFTFGAVFHACSSLATLCHGKMVHGCAMKCGFHAYAYVGNGLVNMYAKCGDVASSYVAFCDILEKDLISWNTMLFAFGLHGWATEALQLLDKMVASSVKPDRVTFIGLLMTCSHSGLIEKGKALFEVMSSIYGLSPEVDHVVCMIDMLGRGGHLEEAKQLANDYLQTHDTMISSYEVLFGACSLHGNMEIGAESGDRLQSVKPWNEMSYVLLSNLYCASGQWKEAETVRKKMADQGLSKMPGISWVELTNGITAFVAGEQSNPNMAELCKTLSILESEMRYPFSIVCWDGIT